MGPMYEKKTVEFGSVASDSLLCKETKRAYISQLKTFEECQHFVRSHCIPGPCVVWCQAHDVFFNYSQNMYLNVLLIVNYLLFFSGCSRNTRKKWSSRTAWNAGNSQYYLFTNFASIRSCSIGSNPFGWLGQFGFCVVS